MAIEVSHYPDIIKQLISTHFASKKVRISVYYCKDIIELKKIATSFDMTIDYVREIDHKSKTIKIYKVGYGDTKIYRFKNKQLAESSLGQYRIYYTEVVR